ncbi:unnamed protein product [Camellia sinensis]
MEKDKSPNHGGGFLPPLGRYLGFSPPGNSFNTKSEPMASSTLPPLGPGSSSETGHFGHGIPMDSSHFSHDISRMPDNPPKNKGHRRAHSKILTLPDDISFDSDLGVVGGLDGPSLSDETEDDLLFMYLDMDKFNSSSATSAFQHSQSMDGSTTIKPEMLMSGSEEASAAELALIDPKRSKRLRAFIKAHNLHETQIFAKIETVEGLRHFDEILQEADGVILSRGNLGIDLAPEKVSSPPPINPPPKTAPPPPSNPLPKTSPPPPTTEPGAPAPSVDCTTLIYGMSDCLTYLTVGSNKTNPEDTCCTGLKTVLDTDANCLCEGLKSSASLGSNIDFKKAKAIPSVCKIPTPPSLTSCDLTSSPSTPGAPSSPALSPDAIIFNVEEFTVIAHGIRKNSGLCNRYQDDWLKTSASSLQLWEKAPLEPYTLQKPMTYYVVCPDIDPLTTAAADFFQQLGTEVAATSDLMLGYVDFFLGGDEKELTFLLAFSKDFQCLCCLEEMEVTWLLSLFTVTISSLAS